MEARSGGKLEGLTCVPRLASWIVTLDHRNARNPTPRPFLSNARNVGMVVVGGKVLWTVLGDCRPEGCRGGGEERNGNGRSEGGGVQEVGYP